MSADTSLGITSEKSPEAFRTIGEVSSNLSVPQHVLRFWEGKFPQVRPMKRSGGRRYYRPEDVALLASIKDMLYNKGLTIRGVQKLLKENSSRREVTVGGGVVNCSPASLQDVHRLSPGAKRDLENVLVELRSMREMLRAGGI